MGNGVAWAGLVGLAALALSFAGGSGAVLPSSSCSEQACVEWIAAGGTCKAAADGSEWGFVHPTGGARVRGNLPLSYNYGMRDSIGLGWEATNWPGPIHHQLNALDNQQGWLMRTTNHVYRYTWTAHIEVDFPSGWWSHSATRWADIPCTPM